MREEADFAEFVRANSAGLVRSAFLLVRDSTAAEDLVQDTLVRLYPNWSRVAAADSALAYVRRSVTNNFLNSRRGKYNAAGREVLVAEAPERVGGVDFATQVGDADLVRELLDSLPPRARAVLVLRFFHDLDDEQIAADLDIRTGTVRSIVSRSLSTLRAQAAAHTRTAGSLGQLARVEPNTQLKGNAS
jgi:RNA polymerase sigma-70 factor (sigma-E family)